MKSTRVFGSFKRAFGVSTAVIGLVGLLALSGSTASADPAATQHGKKPTVVLVHGAFADSSSWEGVVERLQGRGYTVVAPANPLRGLASDAAYLESFLKTVQGPVVLVGHSYGGAVISEAATTDPQVKALVYIAAFQPETGESAGALSAQFPGSKLGPDTTTVVPYSGGADLYLNQADFHAVFAADVPADKAAEMAATQRPADTRALSETLQGAPAWHTIPSWALVATQDQAIPAAAERFMSARAHSHTIEVKASHAVAVSRPDVVTDLISDAARSVK
jgi:pimeloyl-ACP methyl ester carboxylesterase